jgi:hypothetical protein
MHRNAYLSMLSNGELVRIDDTLLAIDSQQCVGYPTESNNALLAGL